jgi:hypothetical protein
MGQHSFVYRKLWRYKMHATNHHNPPKIEWLILHWRGTVGQPCWRIPWRNRGPRFGSRFARSFTSRKKASGLASFKHSSESPSHLARVTVVFFIAVKNYSIACSSQLIQLLLHRNTTHPFQNMLQIFMQTTLFHLTRTVLDFYPTNALYFN